MAEVALNPYICNEDLQKIDVVEYDGIRVALSGKLENLQQIPSQSLLYEERKRKEENRNIELITK